MLGGTVMMDSTQMLQGARTIAPPDTRQLGIFLTMGVVLWFFGGDAGARD